VSQSIVSRSISEICILITRHLMPQYIKFPTTPVEKRNAKEKFFQKWNIKGILGAIDGTHVEIIAPSVNDLEHPPYAYINRKGKHSINVMLICDADNIIVGINARYPGSVHDAAIWQISEIRNYLRTCYYNGDHALFLLGDSGYGQEPWLLTPYANFEDGSPEEQYNIIHKSARNVIERTNGILKSRFRCLSRHRVLNYHPAKAAYIIYSCSVLHNIAIKAK
ncbi:Putative nuclease HARBI1, partial [Ooceraea biroi]